MPDTPHFSPAAWWQPKPDGTTHEVRVLCACPDIEHCDMERYVSDVRMLYRELEQERRRYA